VVSRRTSGIGTLVLAAALLLAIAPAMDARAAGTVAVRRVDTGDFPIVRLTVSAQDESSLGPEDVKITENGVPVQVEAVHPLGSEGQRVDAVLAIDVSNSMRGGALMTALAATRTFVGETPEWIPIGILLFSERPVIVAPVTADRTAAHEAVTSIASTSPGDRPTRSSGSAMFDDDRESAQPDPRHRRPQHGRDGGPRRGGAGRERKRRERVHDRPRRALDR
jgi:hypothetical protein